MKLRSCAVRAFLGLHRGPRRPLLTRSFGERFSRSVAPAAVLVLTGLVACSDTAAGPSSSSSPHTIFIDIDDHGLAGLWMAEAPHLKQLIAEGTLAYSRVIIPTHSNQSNIALLTGQYPEGNDVPANAWLSRAGGFVPPVNVPGFSVGDYARYTTNPLRTRGDSIYQAVHRTGGRTAYVGQLPPFEVGADDVDLPILGLSFGGLTASAPLVQSLLTTFLGYPQALVGSYVLSGPPAVGESQLHFTLREAATYIRRAGANGKMPALMFVWDFIALDDDPTAAFGADGPEVQAVIQDYDAGLGELLDALSTTGLRESTNIVFTLDHGKVDTHKQAVLGTKGATAATTTQAATTADGQLAALVASDGAALGIGPQDYAVLNEDGDAQIYARVEGAGTPAGAARQAEVTHALLTLVQSGKLAGIDTTRTMTADGDLGTRRFADVRGASPFQPDILVFPQDDWTLNQVDRTNATPGPFVEHADHAYGRHGGFSADEIYVPLILQGPAFKKGRVLPYPVEHVDVAPTVLASLKGAEAAPALTTAARGPIMSALKDEGGETWPLPPSPSTLRERVLAENGITAVATLAGDPAPGAVLIDVAGVYHDEIFTDEALAAEAAPLRALAHEGIRFDAFWTRRRDWPVTQWEFLAGSLPMNPYVPTAEDDPLVDVAPGLGVLAMPPAPHNVSHAAGYQAWRQSSAFASTSVLSAAHEAGRTTALVTSSDMADFYALHVPADAFDSRIVAPASELAGQVVTLLSTSPKTVAIVALGGARSGDRHSAAARAELTALATQAVAIAQAATSAGALVLLTSRGATTIDDAAADAYGPGSSRHVPCLLLGPNVRKDVVTGAPAEPEDVPLTLLFGLGAPSAADIARGTFPVRNAGAVTGAGVTPQPATATVGKALVRAFLLGDAA